MTLPVHPEEDTLVQSSSDSNFHQKRRHSAALDVPERATESPNSLSGSPVFAGRSGSPVLNRTLSGSPTSGLVGSPTQHRRLQMRLGRVSPLATTQHSSRNGSQDIEESMELSSVQFAQQVGSQSDGVLPTGVYGHTMEQPPINQHNTGARLSLQGQHSGSNLETIGLGHPALQHISVPNQPLHSDTSNIGATQPNNLYSTINSPPTPIQPSINQNNLPLLPMSVPSNSSNSSSHLTQTTAASDILPQQQPVLSAVPSEQRYPVPNLVPAGSFHLSERGGTQFIDDSDLVQAMEESSLETGVPIHHGK